MQDTPLTLGAVAYDPKVVTIWEGFKEYFAAQGFAFDYILYSNYEAQVLGHFKGHYHVGWNSPSQSKNAGATNPGGHTTLPPAAKPATSPAMSP